MTVADQPNSSPDLQHLVLDGVTWAFYEQLLRELDGRAMRVTFDDGNLEIMSPLPTHEKWGAKIGRMIEMLAFERNIAVEPLGSTTFRRADKRKGLEPDRCYYVQHVDAARQIEEEFDAAIHPPPDLAVEIDVTRRSISKEPIYAALGVPELWRFDGQRLIVRHLSGGNSYESADESACSPFLPMKDFEAFLLRLADEPQNEVLREFQAWVRTL